MLLKTVTYDTESHFAIDLESAIAFLLHTERYLNEIIRHRGYIYLNQICENMCVEWNPDDENPCIKNDGVDRIAFIQFETFRKSDNSLLIHIHRYD